MNNKTKFLSSMTVKTNNVRFNWIFHRLITHNKLFIFTCISMSMLCGCSTMFAHYNLSDNEVQNHAVLPVITNACMENNFLEPSDTNEILYYSKAILSISVYDEDVYNHAYLEGKKKILQEPIERLERYCKEFKPILPVKARNLKQQYIKISQSLDKSRAAELKSFNNSLENLNKSLQQQTNSLQQQLNSQSYSQPSFNYNTNRSYGTPVYNASDCKGSVINSKCYGTVVPSGVQKKCYGTMLNGECIGTVGF